MDAEAKRRAIRWRRLFFGLHLLLFLLVRFAVGALPEMPPAGTYEALFVWGLVVAAHWLALSVVDTRGGAVLPFGWLNRLVEPRERRWLLLIIDVMLWFIGEAGVAGIFISGYYLTRYETPIALLWTLQTLVMLAHLGLATYAEVHDRITPGKRKNDDTSIPALQSDDGELIDFPAIEDAAVKQQVQRN